MRNTEKTHNCLICSHSEKKILTIALVVEKIFLLFYRNNNIIYDASIFLDTIILPSMIFSSCINHGRRKRKRETAIRYALFTFIAVISAVAEHMAFIDPFWGLSVALFISAVHVPLGKDCEACIAPACISITAIIYHILHSGTFNLLVILMAAAYYLISMAGIRIKPESHEKNRTSAETIGSKIEKLLNEDKIYLDRNLTLDSLSAKCNINRTYVSSYFNRTMSTTFTDCINRMRTEEAKRLLTDPEYRNYTLEYVGMISGFSSYSSFRRIFKSFTGKSPSEFKTDSQKSAKE